MTTEHKPHSEYDVALLQDSIDMEVYDVVPGETHRRLKEQVETLRREQTVLDGESVRLNRENRELKEQLEMLQAEHSKLVESAFVETPLEPLADHQAAHREIVGLKEQLEAAQRELDQCRQAFHDRSTPNPARTHFGPPGDNWGPAELDSSPASDPHEHTWSIPDFAGVYRCMVCGVEGETISVSNQESRGE